MNRTGSVLRLIVCSTLISATGFMLMQPAAAITRHVSSSTSKWRGPKLIDRKASLASISCPTATFCVAIDFLGYVVTYDGTSWSKPSSTDLTNFAGPPGSPEISCPSASFCMALGPLGQEEVTYNGTQWSSASQLPSGAKSKFASLSCTGPSFCVEAGLGEIYIYNGSTWKASHSYNADNPTAQVSCASDTFCAAVGWGGIALTYNGASWSSAKNVNSGGTLSSVSCPANGDFCSAVAQTTSALTYNGTAWSKPETIEQGYKFFSVSCSSSSFCATTAIAPAPVLDDNYLVTYDGSSSSVISTSVSYPELYRSVSCPGDGTCFAVGGGDLLTLRS